MGDEAAHDGDASNEAKIFPKPFGRSLAVHAEYTHTQMLIHGLTVSGAAGAKANSCDR